MVVSKEEYQNINAKIHEARRKNNVFIWQIAPRYGKSESTMYRLLRTEMPIEEQNRIIQIIKDIAQERENH